MKCRTCLIDKPDGAFYASNHSKCKECVKEAVRANRLRNIARVRQYDRLRGGQPHRVAARAEHRKTAAYAQSHEAAALRWAAKHPERRKASHLVNNAIRDGRLHRQPCWVCGSKAEAHHPDYSRPLDVVWLCGHHHRQAHALAANQPSMTETA